MKTNIGGDRLGSGAKINVELKNYSRSTHNLTTVFRSAMAPGVLVPCYVKPALIGDTFDIDLDAMVKTLPTQGPLMGSFKVQIDFFQCPLRLYQGILHNNALNLGLNMKNVLLPSLQLQTFFDRKGNNVQNSQINPNCLLRYCGLSGIGDATTSGTSEVAVERKVSALPILMYYDIFKNYYANKQEENAYVIGGDTEAGVPHTEGATLIFYTEDETHTTRVFPKAELFDVTFSEQTLFPKVHVGITFTSRAELNSLNIIKGGTTYNVKEIFEEETEERFVENYAVYPIDPSIYGKPMYNLEFDLIQFFDITNTIQFAIDRKMTKTDSIKLNAFPLENIDKMRQKILSLNDISDHLIIGKKSGQYNIMPYKQLTGVHDYGDGVHEETDNTYALNGLCVKTYQSDIFNNWINTEFIDGTNGINEITKVAVNDDGEFTIDQLIMQKKVYDMLNQIAIKGGTYQDWQEAVSGQHVVGHMETPIYCGGMSSEVVFEELSSNSSGTYQGEEQPLGTLAGKGKAVGKKAGHLVIKVGELSYIMGIISITPRLDYFQGNEWFMTDIKTPDDFHKAALDQIGFQDLIGEQMAWWDTKIENGNVKRRSSVGKVPAWTNYMTDVNHVYSDFAQPDGKGFMVLTRNYGVKYNTYQQMTVADFTTYIDPSKFNYAFTNASLSAQNFWAQVVIKNTARRIMSAKVMPNL